MQRDGSLVPPLAAAEYSEEQIGDKDDKRTDQDDDPIAGRLLLTSYRSDTIFPIDIR